MIYPLHQNFGHCCLQTTQPSTFHMTTLSFLRLLPTQNFKKSANFFAQINWCCIQTKLNLLFFHAPILIRMFVLSATITTMAKIPLKIFIQSLVYIVQSNDNFPAVKFLGVYFDPDLNFKFHISFLRKKLSKALYALRTV